MLIVSCTYIWAMRLLIVSLLSTLCHYNVEAKFRCHKYCNGHGVCNDDNVCLCESGWQGPDCSLKTCDLGRAWADKPWSIDNAHSYAECSNRGKCNRKTGICECFAGFEGPACQKSTCGSTNCNGHGQCATMNQAYQLYTSYTSEVKIYNSWETNHVTMCICHYGYGGPDCSYRLCAKGDDPITPSNGYRTIKIISDVQQSAGGLLRFTFNGQSFFFPPDANKWRDAECKTSFESLPNVESVNCTSKRLNARRTEYTVAFIKFPVEPYENNIFTNNGNPPLSVFSCDTSMITGSRKVSCEVLDMITGDDKNLPEYLMCSNRGVCNFNTGLCKCITDFTNSNCDSYAEGYSSYSTTVSSDVLGLVSANTNFRSAVLHLQSYVEGTSDFRFFKIETVSGTVFELDGSGSINMNYGGVTVGLSTDSVGGSMVEGGLTLYGGTTINADGLYCKNNLTIRSGVDITDDGFTVTGKALMDGGVYSLEGMSIYSRGMRNRDSVVTYAGGATVSLGGMTVNDGLNISAGGLAILRRGMTIYDLGLKVKGGIFLTGTAGMDARTGVTVYDSGFTASGGVTIFDSGMQATTEGMTINSGGMGISSGLIIYSSGMLVTGGLSVETEDLVVSGGLTVNSEGIFAQNGIFVSNSGFSILSGGLDVQQGGFTISDSGLVLLGGITLAAGSMNILGAKVSPRGLGVAGSLQDNYNGVIVSVSGMSVNGGISVVDTGVKIETDGGRVNGGISVTDGLQITGGIDVQNRGVLAKGNICIPFDGLNAYGGLSISALGLYVTQGLTVQDQGIVVSGGLTVEIIGMRVTGGATVASGGLVISTSGLSLTDSGLFVSGGISSHDAGIFITTSGISVASDGFTAPVGITVNSQSVLVPSAEIFDGITSNAGMTIRSSGLSISAAGMSILSGGLIVTEGCTVAGGLVASSTFSEIGSFTADNGITILSPGINLYGLRLDADYVSATGGVTINTLGVVTPMGAFDGGLESTIGGFTINDVGLSVPGGITMTGHLMVVKGLTSYNAGIKVAEGLTVNSNGLKINSGLTIQDYGLYSPQVDVGYNGLLVVQNGLSINSGGYINSLGGSVKGGIHAAQGMVIRNSGIQVPNGLSNGGVGIYVSSGGLTANTAYVSAGLRVIGGLVATGGISIVDGGIDIKGGLKVNANSVQLSGSGTMTVEDVGVYVTSDITVVGKCAVTALYTTSDANLKENVVGLDHSLMRLSKLRGVYYSLRSANHTLDSTGPKDRHVGVIAQDVLRALPEAVIVHEYMSVRYEELIPLVLEAVQEIRQNITLNAANFDCDCELDLEAQIANARSKLRLLERDNTYVRTVLLAADSVVTI